MVLNYNDVFDFNNKDKINPKFKSENPKSTFNLKNDLFDFKNRMEESDTIKIWFDHSVSSFQGYERLRILKKSDSLYISSEFKEEKFTNISEWKVIYTKSIPVNDTIWKFEDFIRRNVNRLKKNISENDRLILQIANNNDKIEFHTTGLVDYNRFLKDYINTMKELFPGKNYYFHDVDIVEE